MSAFFVDDGVSGVTMNRNGFQEMMALVEAGKVSTVIVAGRISITNTPTEDEFVKIVMDEQYKQIQIQQRKNQETLQTLLARTREVDVLYEKLFEEKILGNLTEERFK